MKIPTYQQNIQYQRVSARNVAVAEPILEKTIGTAEKWGIIGNLSTRLGEAYLRKREEIRRAKQQSKSSAKQGQKNIQYSGFSSEQRDKLYQFCQTKAWQTDDTQQMTKNASTQSAVEKLDFYFGTQVQDQDNSFPHENPDRNLLAQDYAVLRSEIQHIQNTQQEQQRKFSFQEGCRRFIQTAGLIRTPGTLENYVQANLSAAQQEFFSNEKQAHSWAQQKQQLYQQAIGHNIEVALGAGEVLQAEQMYSHFKDHLPPTMQPVWQAKLTAAKARKLAAQIAPKLYDQCVSDENSISAQQVEHMLQAYCEQTGVEKDAAFQAIKSELQKTRMQRLQKASQRYLNLLSVGKSADGQSEVRQLLASWPGSAEEVNKVEKIVCALQNTEEKQGNPAVFNRLQAAVYDGTISQKQIDLAFENEQLNAADALRLKSRCCTAQAGKMDPKEKVLFHSVYRLCKQHGLDEQATEEAVHSVFGGSEKAEEHLQAAQELKKWLML